MNSLTERYCEVIEDDLDLQLLIKLRLEGESTLKVSNMFTTVTEAMESGRIESEILILDHYIDGQLMGIQAAPLIKAANPKIKIILFTSHDLASEARREPAIDAFLLKRNINKLLPTVLRLFEQDSPTK